MTKSELYEFVDTMNQMGDDWDVGQADAVYGNWSLEDAINDRTQNMDMFGDPIDSLINR
ncbi:MAG: hypothetical protein J6S45_07590 [Firmicutes bacterium]|nr:hypothetical protein [Bacillota bacterium]